LGCCVLFDRIWIKSKKFAQHRVGLEADGLRVRTDIRAAKDARWPTRHVISLQRLQKRHADLGFLGNRCERHVLSLTL
jgi:hypothetical protein